MTTAERLIDTLKDILTPLDNQDDPEGVCIHCGREEYHDRAGYGFHVQECDKCERPVCENCCESDYDLVGDPPYYECTQWECNGGRGEVKR